MKSFYQDFKLGIIGGGQLGRMLLQACSNLNVTSCVLDPSEDGPCSGLASEYTKGSLLDYETVYNFGKQLDMLTIEIENVNVQALYQLEREGVAVYPQPRVIEIIPAKRVQKPFYLDHEIPTSDFVLVESRDDIEAQVEFLPAYNKLGQGGYDGGGVQKLESEKDISMAFDARGLLEEVINFQSEISVIAARNVKGEVRVFPVVECVFHPTLNLVDYLVSPSSLPTEIQQTAEELAIKKKAKDVVDFLNLTHLSNELAGNLSGGQKKLLELGRTMMVDAKLVLLDEVGAGVNRTLLKDLGTAILKLNKEQGYTFCMIEHDMEFISRLCDPVIVMAEGSVLFEGTAEEVKKDEKVIESYLGRGSKIKDEN